MSCVTQTTSVEFFVDCGAFFLVVKRRDSDLTLDARGGRMVEQGFVGHQAKQSLLPKRRLSCTPKNKLSFFVKRLQRR